MIEIIDAYRRSGSEWCACCQKQANTKRIRFSQDGRQGMSIVLCDNCRKELSKALEQEPTTKESLVVAKNATTEQVGNTDKLDCISRQAVLELAYDMSEIDGEHYTEPCMVVDVEDIQKLPSVKPQEPKTGWIPVNERLPEDGQNVLFCDIDDDIMIGYHVKGRAETHFSQDGTYDDMKNVRAWMPLPEPYKEG